MKALYKGIILFLLVVFIGVLLLAVSLLLPKGIIHNSVYFSVDTFADEMDLPRTVTDYPMTMLDNNTDAWMLLIADYHAPEESLADQIFLGQYAVYDENKTGLVGMDSINSLQAEQILRVGEYPRYWHGWLFPLRLALCVFNYSGIINFKSIYSICFLIFAGSFGNGLCCKHPTVALTQIQAFRQLELQRSIIISVIQREGIGVRSSCKRRCSIEFILNMILH